MYRGYHCRGMCWSVSNGARNSSVDRDAGKALSPEVCVAGGEEPCARPLVSTCWGQKAELSSVPQSAGTHQSQREALASWGVRPRRVI